MAPLLAPRGAGSGGVRDLLSYQMPEDSTAQYCAPSYAVQQWSIPGPITGQPGNSAFFLEVQDTLA
ncbi:hypothetical protein [Nocardia vulneris]|uniref:Uncharacterized protein n=1 Tax=Nocardia vulneris TaxID=1141657 RepID=A0ABR4ZEB0_9NOCA|nr:hypothetical protein [Nocardia vulneris]KIA63670.1 hypothetical protein FG87_17795 [Nocardia vulneris]